MGGEGDAPALGQPFPHLGSLPSLSPLGTRRASRTLQMEWEGRAHEAVGSQAQLFPLPVLDTHIHMHTHTCAYTGTRAEGRFTDVQNRYSCDSCENTG